MKQFFVFTLVAGFFSSAAMAIPLTGTMTHDRRTGGLSYDLELGTARAHYSVSGATTSDPSLSLVRNVDLDFAGVEIEKVDRRGNYQVERLENAGVLHLGAMERVARGITFAGMPVSGRFSSSLVNSNRLNGLRVDGVESQGGFNYSIFNGKDRVVRGTQFGRYALHAAASAEDGAAFDWDDYFGQDLVQVHLVFGDLVIEGTIQHSQNGDTIVVSHFNIDIKARDGSGAKEVTLAEVGQPLTSVETQLRAFLVFLQVFGTDLAS